MPRGVGRPGGRKFDFPKSLTRPLTHGGHRLEVRQRTEPYKSANKVEQQKQTAQKKKDKKTVRMLTKTKLSM